MYSHGLSMTIPKNTIFGKFASQCPSFQTLKMAMVFLPGTLRNCLKFTPIQQ